MNRTVSTGHTQQTKLRLPKRILLVRHGQSLGNVDEEAYQTIPDWLIPITETGEMQAKEMGKKVKAMIGNEPIFVYYSPYLRTRQTMIGMMDALQDNPIYGIREEPRITEQQFGNFQNQDMEVYKKEKSSFGRFYYRFPEGESGLDVYNRVTSFIGSLFREWYSHTADEEFRDTNVIIVTHGLSLRLFIMRWFHFTVHQFEQSMNPSNGAIIAMERMTKRVERSPNITIPKGNSGFVTSDDGSLPRATSLSQQHHQQVGLSTSFEDDYILDLHPVSSYEQVELSRFAKTPPARNGQVHHNNNTSQPNWYQTISSKTHHPRRYHSRDNLNTFDYDPNTMIHSFDDEAPPPPTPSVKDELEYFVLTKESQDLLQFHIPKMKKKVESTKYFRWKEYNQIFKLEEEIAADVESLTLCPRRRLTRGIAGGPKNRSSVNDAKLNNTDATQVSGRND